MYLLFYILGIIALMVFGIYIIVVGLEVCDIGKEKDDISVYIGGGINILVGLILICGTFIYVLAQL